MKKPSRDHEYVEALVWYYLRDQGIPQSHADSLAALLLSYGERRAVEALAEYRNTIETPRPKGPAGDF